jgi:outer membrane protein OmpA-like peptidoglycan-associated protein
MTVNFDEVDTHGIAAGAEFGPSRGYIRSEDNSFGDIVEEAASIETVRYETRYGGGSVAHFELGSALLSRFGKRLLGQLGAAEVALLALSASRLDLVGSADRVDVEWYNKLLSKVRAENALQVLRDTLGADLAATAVAVGLGEKLPIDAGLDDGTEAAEFRRVFVEYAGRPIANLQVARK